jgi:hypothetical protein
MLLLKPIMSALVATAWLYTPHLPTSATPIDLAVPVLRPTALISVPGKETDPLVRIRLVDTLRGGSVASISLPAGSSEVVTMEVKRSALSEQVLAAAFGARASITGRRAARPTANIVVYIPDKLGPRTLSRSDQLKFARLVTELQAAAPGTFIQISGD